jgi:predicted acylesterase/phospholipase RssA
MVARLSPVLSRKISSFGFSGAGFLASYHLGVGKCLVDQGIIPGSMREFSLSSDDEEPSSRPLILAGVSSGSLIATALSAGVDPVDGMQVLLDLRQRSREAGKLDSFQPGYSLVDDVERVFSRAIRQAVGEDDEEFFLQTRIGGGRLLRIGLTDRRKMFPPLLSRNSAELSGCWT